MRFIKADVIFPVSSPPVEDGIVVVRDDGVVQELILSTVDVSDEKIEYFHGVICPGFVNTHCHLELSHLKNKVTVGKGLPHFISEIISRRQSSHEVISEAIEKADNEMFKNGIVAVGDISNTDQSFEVKKKSPISYYTFIELFDLDPSRTDEQFKQGQHLLGELKNSFGLEGALTPHAPYSVTPQLMKKIHDDAYDCGGLLTVHNQETRDENDMFTDGKGELFELLRKGGADMSWFRPTGFHSLPSFLVHFPRCNKMQLVHNTYTSSEDITWAHLYSMMVWWCTCPNANLFIEKKLPDYRLFSEAGCRMTVGTDSYASNWSLSILDELKTISSHADYLSLETLLRWATLNGAQYLGLQKMYGSIEPGKKPGLNLITNIDSESHRLTKESAVEKII